MKNKFLASLFFSISVFLPRVAMAAWDVQSIEEFGLPEGSISGIIVGILNWILAGFGIIGVIGFLIAGILYITSIGEKESMEKAKRAMQYCAYGVIVGLAGLVVIQAVNYALNAQSF